MLFLAKYGSFVRWAAKFHEWMHVEFRFPRQFKEFLSKIAVTVFILMCHTRIQLCFEFKISRLKLEIRDKKNN